MKRKRRAEKESPKTLVKGVFGQPQAGFYRQPVLHINCRGLVEVEGCKEILLYDEQQIRLDLGRWQVSLFGDDLRLCGVSGRLLLLKGRVFRTEFSYKE